MAQQTLTVLFTDLVGSTELLTRLDDRAGDRLRRAHFAALRREIGRHQGREVKNTGDGVMAVFSTARHGLACGAAMQRSIRLQGFRRDQPALSIRIGVSTGDVRLEGGDCFGISVVEASRLCAYAMGGQTLASDRARLVADAHDLAPVGEVELKGLGAPTFVWEVPPVDFVPVRAVIADDSLLMREGIAHVLELCGIEVTGQACDAPELLRLTDELRPDVAIVDLRMPPSHTDEGLRAAEHILATHGDIGVLLLSQDTEPRYAKRLRAARRTGVGYLLKERVADGPDFAEAARAIAGGGHVFDPSLSASSEATV